MTLPKGDYRITIEKARLVVKEEDKEYFIEIMAKIGKQMLSIRLPVVSIKWRKAKKGGDKRDWSWYNESLREKARERLNQERKEKD